VRGCAIDGCDRIHRARGYCYMHYRRVLRQGDPLVRYPTAPRAKLFWPKVDKDGPIHPYDPELGPCWLWTGARNPRGYGLLGSTGKGRRRVFTHRWALEDALGRPLADGLLALHSCDNPPCCNPAHLREGTYQGNAADAAARGRMGSTGRKLTAETVLAIRNLRANGETYTSLASRFGVQPETIRTIVLGLSWRHVGGPVGRLVGGEAS